MSEVTMTVSLPEDLKRYVDRRAAETGHGNAGEFVQELIRQDQLRREQAERKLEALLLEGLESLEQEEPVRVTADFWEERRARLLGEVEQGQYGQAQRG